MHDDHGQMETQSMNTDDISKFKRFDNGDGLVEYKIVYDSADKLCIRSRKEVFERRADGLRILYRTNYCYGMKFAHFENPYRISTFIRKPYSSEFLWKYRLDGLVCSVFNRHRSLRTDFEGRPDKKSSCLLTMTDVVEREPLATFSVTFSDGRESLAASGILANAHGWPHALQPHVREFNLIYQMRMRLNPTSEHL